MEIEVDKYYKTRDGYKAYVGYKYNHSGQWYVGGHIFDERGYIENSYYWCIDGSCSVRDSFLVAHWEDEPEEIDIGAMWLALAQHNGGERFVIGRMSLYKPSTLINSRITEIITVKDWADIQQGKRKLIVGEGL